MGVNASALEKTLIQPAQMMNERKTYRRNEHANGKGTQNIEEQQTPEHSANGFGDVSCRVSRLTCCHSDLLRSPERKRGIDQGVEETQKPTLRASCNIRVHGSGMFPVSKTQSIMGRTAAQVQHYGENEKADNGDNLDRSEDKLRFSVDIHSHDVQYNDNEKYDKDPGGGLFADQR